MSQERKEQLYDMLFDVLSELSEHESSEIIFDKIVDNFAAMIEYHTQQKDTFKSMLDTFRHELPQDYVPEALDDSNVPGIDLSAPPTFEEIYGGMNDINRSFMSENQDILEEFMRSAKFPDKLDS